ncbi:MAG: rhomboid family intramembrane serine protease [Planctomycetota bacterium]
MGIEQRDYYRDDPRDFGGPSGIWDMPPVCKRLLVATVIAFVLQMIFLRPPAVNDVPFQFSETQIEQMREETPDLTIGDMVYWLPPISVVEDVASLDPRRVASGQVWRVFSYPFLHDRNAPWHLIINMIFLYWFGSRLERMYGATEFCLFYFLSATLAGISYLALSYYTGNTSAELGASGAIWALVILYVIHHPYEQVHVYFLFPIQIRVLALIYLVYDLHPVLLAMNGQPGLVGGVGNAAHLGGAAFGALYFYRSWRLTPLWNRLRGKPSSRWETRTVRRPARSVVPFDRGNLDASRGQSTKPRIDPATKRLEAQLDRVLEKIQDSGRDSLTEEEISVLEQASQKYRDR